MTESLRKMVNGQYVDLTEEEIKAREAEIAKAQEKSRLTGYIEKRRQEYPSQSEQIEIVMKQLEDWRANGTIDLLAEVQDMLDKIDDVKAKYPKPVN